MHQSNESSTVERILAGAGILIIGAGAAVVGYFNPTTAGFFPVCPLHAMTGLNCPGCGLTRGFHALLNGEVLTALHFNALLPFFGLMFGIFAVSMFLVAVRGRGLSVNFYRPFYLWSFLILLIGFGILRNLPFYPFNLLHI